MRKQLRFSKFGKILQEKEVKAGETAEIFKLEMPKNHVGFLYYLANNYSPLKLNIDGEKMDVKGIMAPINEPKLFDPPFLIENFIEATAFNSTKENKKISFCADGVAYSVITASEETLISEVKEQVKQVKAPSPVIKTEEKRPRKPHLINHKINEADQWYEIKLPKEEIKAWSLRCREKNEINYCFEPSGSTYMTISGGENHSEDTSPGEDINAIYVRSPVADVTVELELWL